MDTGGCTYTTVQCPCLHMSEWIQNKSINLLFSSFNEQLFLNVKYNITSFCSFKILQVEVRIREGRAVNIHMFCARRPGLLLSTMRALDSLGLDIQQAVISCFNGFALDVFRAEVCFFVYLSYLFSWPKLSSIKQKQSIPGKEKNWEFNFDLHLTFIIVSYVPQKWWTIWNLWKTSCWFLLWDQEEL